MPSGARINYASFLSTAAYVCPSCTRALSKVDRRITKRGQSNSSSRAYHSKLPNLLVNRRISTNTATGAVHVPRSTPTSFRRLDDSLIALERDAAVYVNPSQLRLARRGLESYDAVTRIAVLGVGSRDGASRLARVLLADPLTPEAEWERHLIENEQKDGRAILVKYGDKTKLEDGHPLVRTLSVPSAILQTHNIEILVHSADNASQISGAGSILVPSLDIRSSFGGRTSTVTYPVHKSLLYAAHLSQLSLINHPNSDSLKGMTKMAIDGPWSGLESAVDHESFLNPINLNLGELAIETLRKSLEQSAEFERAWFNSGLPSVSSWLQEGTQTSANNVKSSVYNLMELIYNDVSQKIKEDESSKTAEVETESVPVTIRENLERFVSSWAEDAHSELQHRLAGAFMSKSWNKTRWWKLLWRVDEVGFIARDILQRAWLVGAEKEWIWLCGKVHQSGLLGPLTSLPVPKRESESPAQGSLGQPRPLKTSDLVDRTIPFESDEGDPYIAKPWPPDIFLARSSLIRDTVPPLQALSQKLLLQAFTTTALTSALSTLIYTSVSTASVFEAGAVAALGVVYSLRRLQKRWESARSIWQEALREKGKDVLRELEGDVREVVQLGGQAQLDASDLEQREIAKRAAENVREAMDELQRAPRQR